MSAERMSKAARHINRMATRSCEAERERVQKFHCWVLLCRRRCGVLMYGRALNNEEMREGKKNKKLKRIGQKKQRKERF